MRGNDGTPSRFCYGKNSLTFRQTAESLCDLYDFSKSRSCSRRRRCIAQPKVCHRDRCDGAFNG